MFPKSTGSTYDEVYQRVRSTGTSETFVEYYAPLDRTFSIKASPLGEGLSVYLHDIGEGPSPIERVFAAPAQSVE